MFMVFEVQCKSDQRFGDVAETVKLARFYQQAETSDLSCVERISWVHRSFPGAVHFDQVR